MSAVLVATYKLFYFSRHFMSLLEIVWLILEILALSE
ncbi:MAG: hypothetical protein HNEKOMLI_00361 [Sodalis sp. Psp]|nr:hypothetical protein [Sodalis sp. Psp]MCR3756847.1 hypothetical protein [Sodalis sp. Ppy]